VSVRLASWRNANDVPASAQTGRRPDRSKLPGLPFPRGTAAG
jgi:hypothetical protein